MLLSEEQQIALDKFKKGENLFITGPGGTGKTFLIKEMLKVCKRSVQVCALTGCAAILLDCGARTIHSWSGIKIANGEIYEIVDRLYNNKYVIINNNNNIYNNKKIIIIIIKQYTTITISNK